MPPEEKKKSVFDAIPSKTSFFAGLIAGVMVFSTVGFILVLAGGLKLPSIGGNDVVWGANANPSPAPSPSPTAATGDPVGTVIPVGKDDHVRGDLNKAKVVLVEYSDFECPFCKTFTPTVDQILKDYGDKVALVYRHFPLSFHANAQKEAEASECVAELGGNNAFWSFHDKIFDRTTSNGTGFALTALGPLAAEVGVNQAKFQTCLDSGKYAAKVAAEETGGEAAGINGTPGTLVLTKDGQTQMISGAQGLATIKAMLDPLVQ